ncbi:MAG: hypothetical protein K8R68_02705 [Bacteroidales bacterium]|nr:hypothetical protein [Bacteroidales bacterium]
MIYRKTRTSVTIFLLSIIFSILFLQCQTSSNSNEEKSEWEKAETENTMQAYDEYLNKFPDGEFVTDAKTTIAKILIDDAKTGNPIESFDAYVLRFPEGKNKSVFEPIIYKYVIEQDSIEFFEEYVKRFPKSKYLNDFESIIYNRIKNGKSSLSFPDFVRRFPESKYLSSMDTMLYDSAKTYKKIELYDEYVEIFKKGSFKNDIDSIFEQLLYNKAIGKNSVESFNRYLSRFKHSEHVKMVKVESSPATQQIDIIDKFDSIWKTLTTPSSFSAIEGTHIKTLILNSDYKKDELDYIVSNEEEQLISRTLKVHSTTIISEHFTETNSPWTFSTSKNKSEIANDVLRCSVKNSQLQKLQKLDIDFKKNYEIEIRFKFTKTITSYQRSYVGIIWGEETKVKYYFISSQGRYNYGIQSPVVSSENPNGYSGWEGYKETSDKWLKTDNYNVNDYNILKIIKIGSQIKYYINGKYVHFENDMTRFRNSWAGYGIGNVNANIDYFKILQYTD